MEALKFVSEKRMGVFMATFERMIDQKLEEAKKLTFKQKCFGKIKTLFIYLIILAVLGPFLLGVYRQVFPASPSEQQPNMDYTNDSQYQYYEQQQKRHAHYSEQE